MAVLNTISNFFIVYFPLLEQQILYNCQMGTHFLIKTNIFLCLFVQARFETSKSTIWSDQFSLLWIAVKSEEVNVKPEASVYNNLKEISLCSF